MTATVVNFFTFCARSRATGLALGAGMLLSATVTGCANEGDDELVGDFDQDRIIEITSDSTCVPLVKRRGDVGTVCMTIDNDVDTSAQCGEGSTGVMNVTFETEGPWELIRARVGVGHSLEDFPRNRRGRVIRNELPYQSGEIPGQTSHTLTVPLCEVGLDGADEVCDPVNAHLVAHARVRRLRRNGTYRSRSVFGDGTMVGSRRRHGRMFTLELSCAEGEPPPPPQNQCETAFAAGPGATCFLGNDFDGDGLDDGFAEWGWTNGPVSPGTSTEWPVYAAVGGCDPSQGSQVGTLGVSYDGSTASFVFNRVGDVTLDGEQLYVGGEALARDENNELSINPADFPISVDLDDATTSTHTVSGLSGDINVVYHATACGDGIEANPDPLTVLTDEFSTEGDMGTWQQHMPQDARVAVEDDALVIEPNANTWWYAQDETLHVYKTISGDFAATTSVEVTTLDGEPVAPGDPYRIGGLMMRDMGSELPNTYHMGIGNMNTAGVVTVSKSTDEGSSSIGTQPWNGIEAEMRICRVGDEVQSFIRLEDEAWRLIDQRTRGDLPDTLAVGPIAYAGTAVPDLHVETDYVTFHTVSSLQDCYRD